MFAVTYALLSASIGLAAPQAPPTSSPRSPPSQSWPVSVEAGAGALGFRPWPANPIGIVGTEVRLFQRRVYELHLGLGLGFIRQPEFAQAAILDTPLGQRLRAPFGLYADIDLVLGAQASRIPGVIHRRGPSGALEPGRSPLTFSARLGLGLSLGYDFGALTRAPLRVFVSYQQIALTPFMLGNDLPAMGSASITGGVAFELGKQSTK